MTDAPRVDLEQSGLTIHVATGTAGRIQAHYANYMWLRDNCPSSFDQKIGDRQFDIVSAPADIRPDDARIECGDLVITWAGDGHVSRYDIGWLTGWLIHPGHEDPARIEPRYWGAGFRDNLSTFQLKTLIADRAAYRSYLATLLRDGIAMVEDVPDDEEGVRLVAEIAGHVRSSFSGYYFDVKAYPSPVGTAYTAQALEPHTDNPCEEFPAGLQYLHCRVNDTTGGETTFVDGAAVAMKLKATHPKDYEILSSVSVPFRFSHTKIDMRARQTVIILDDRGEFVGVTISQHMADLFDLDQRLLDSYYPAFRRFASMLRDPEHMMPIRLAAGQCIVFDNQRIVHGRAAYDPTSGSRLLRGCYTDRGELRSRYRVAIRDTSPFPNEGSPA
ncbi:MAG: TauD/TfdA family dioxygenase [Alphaproteobacteria bacterium]